jgi:hypothetical protein
MALVAAGCGGDTEVAETSQTSVSPPAETQDPSPEVAPVTDSGAPTEGDADGDSLCAIDLDSVGTIVGVTGELAFVDELPDGAFAGLESGGCFSLVWITEQALSAWPPSQLTIGSTLTVEGIVAERDGEAVIEVSQAPAADDDPPPSASEPMGDGCVGCGLIDVHTHFGAFDTTVIDEMNEAGVGYAVVFVEPVLGEDASALIDRLFEFRDRVLPFVGARSASYESMPRLTPTEVDWIEGELGRRDYVGIGEILVKCDPCLGDPIDLEFDDPSLIRLYELAATAGIPITLHIEGPHLAEFEVVAAQYPDTSFIVAHCGRSMAGQDTVTLAGVLSLANVVCDISGMSDLADPGFVALVEAIPSEFLFGTDTFLDAGMQPPSGARLAETVLGFTPFLDGLDPDVQDQVRFGNAAKMFGLDG